MSEQLLNLDGWLAAHGYYPDLFDEKSLRAERDKRLFGSGQSAYVGPLDYQNLEGTANSTDYRYFFACEGGGKTSLRMGIKHDCDRTLDNNLELGTLAVEYTQHDFEKQSRRNALDHTREIASLVTEALIEHSQSPHGQAQRSNLRFLSSNLRDFIVERFKKDEFETLIFDLNVVKWDSLRGETINAKAQSAIEWFAHRGALGVLVDEVCVARKVTRVELMKMPETESPAEVLRHLVKKCREANIQGICVLVDNLYDSKVQGQILSQSGGSVARLKGFFNRLITGWRKLPLQISPGNQHQTLKWSFEYIRPLASRSDLFEIPGLDFKFFLPLEMESLANEHLPVNRWAKHRISWDEKMLRRILVNRLLACQKPNDAAASQDMDRIPSVGDLCESPLSMQIDNYVVEVALKNDCPRAMLLLGHYLLQEHFKMNRIRRNKNELISQKAFENACKSIENTGINLPKI